MRVNCCSFSNYLSTVYKFAGYSPETWTQLGRLTLY